MKDAVTTKARKERAKRINEVIDLVIKRSGVSKKTIAEGAYKRFFVDNMDLLTPSERQQYKDVIL